MWETVCLAFSLPNLYAESNCFYSVPKHPPVFGKIINLIDALDFTTHANYIYPPILDIFTDFQSNGGGHDNL